MNHSLVLSLGYLKYNCQYSTDNKEHVGKLQRTRVFSGTQGKNLIGLLIVNTVVYFAKV